MTGKYCSLKTEEFKVDTKRGGIIGFERRLLAPSL